MHVGMSLCLCIHLPDHEAGVLCGPEVAGKVKERDRLHQTVLHNHALSTVHHMTWHSYSTQPHNSTVVILSLAYMYTNGRLFVSAPFYVN